MANFADPNFTRPEHLLGYIDTVTNGYGFEIFLIVIFVTAYVGLLASSSNSKKAFTGSTFFTTFMAVLFFWMNLIPIGWLLFSLVLLLFAIVILLVSRDPF